MKHCFSLFLLFFCLSFSLKGQQETDSSVLLLDTKHYSSFSFLEKQGGEEFFLTADCEPLATVADCVNVSSGHFFQVEKDLKSNTIDPLYLKRFYDSSSLYETFLATGFGCQFPLVASGIEKSKKHSYALISERDGFLLSYQGDLDSKGDHERRYWINPQILEKGYTSLSRQEGSGKDNFVNWQGKYRRYPKDGKFWVVKQGEGIKRTYGLALELSQKVQKEIGFPSASAYFLTEQTKANGNRLVFDYEILHGKPFLKSVKTLSRVGSVVINELLFKHRTSSCTVRASCGSQVRYEKINKKFPLGKDKTVAKSFLIASHSTLNGSTFYKQEEKEFTLPKILQVQKPEGRLLQIHYNSLNQVIKLEAPAGEHQDLFPIYRFEYRKNKTKVWDALGQFSIYWFDADQRPYLIEERKNQQVVKKKIFEWSTFPGQKGWLRAKSLGDDQTLLYHQTYRYDNKGNCTRKTLYGNLTGEKNFSFTAKDLALVDRYVTCYNYSQDERNLLILKEKAEGLKIKYRYLPGTNLCTHEWHHYEGKIQERFFKSYDENGEVSLIIEDDGSAKEAEDLSFVTYRRIKSFVTEKQVGLPSFGKPVEINESYRDPATGSIILLNKTQLVYDLNGKECKRSLYDAEGILQKEWTKFYDEKQRLIQETDANGQSTSYAYDANNNKILEVKNRYQVNFVYNAANRLKTKIEKHDDGREFFTSYVYNLLGQLIQETDPSNNNFYYTYDRLGNQISCTQPAMQDETGAVICPSWHKVYNVGGHLIAQTNEKGLTTHYTRNSYGQITSILYPDQAKECFTYYPWGWLKSKQLTNQTSVHYQYDPKGRLLKETTQDREGKELKNESYFYKGELLQFKIDARGISTFYFYNGAGQKVREVKGDHEQVTSYCPDGLGRLLCKKEAINSQEERVTTYRYDGLDRLTHQETSDQAGQKGETETFTYDEGANLTAHSKWQSTEKKGTTHWFYNSNHELISQKDPLGDQTTWSYDHRFINALGQQVNRRLKKDPLGREVEEVKDAFQRVVTQKIYFQGQQQSVTNYVYNSFGTQVKEISSVYVNQMPTHLYGVEKFFDTKERLIKEKEIPSGKTVQFVYDSCGKMVQKIKADGVTLNYIYDPLGRLSHVSSTDGTIKNEYTYDANDNIKTIKDSVHSLLQIREYDPLNRLVKEQLNQELIFHYTYDGLSRLTQLTLPDGSWIKYSYNAFHLKNVQRFDGYGKLLYSCENVEYTLDNKLLTAASPLGLVHYTYDPLGRITSVQANNQFHLKLQGFDGGGNLKGKEQKNDDEIREETFTYDVFDHVISEKDHAYRYDSLGNCLSCNQHLQLINENNQVLEDGTSHYTYDLNGNLIAQTEPPRFYRYDAYDRLIFCQTEKETFEFLYDAYGRCLEIKSLQGRRQLLYQGEKEIGSLINGKIDELRLVHPHQLNEQVFSLELQGAIFFPLQDERFQVCALRTSEGDLVQTRHYSTFAKSLEEGAKTFVNPWGFANRREVAGLVLFLHRFYNPQLRRWQTADPLGFADGLNLYTYVHNNPYLYLDSDGCLAWALSAPVLELTFGCLGFSCPPLALTLATAFAVCSTAYLVNDSIKNYRMKNAMLEMDVEEKTEDKEKQEKEKFTFPENPDDLLPDLPRDKKGRIRTADNLRIRPEKHPIEENETYNPRHHGQHYHIETRRDPSKENWQNENVNIIKPTGYKPGMKMGTGFFPGETFPGVNNR